MNWRDVAGSWPLVMLAAPLVLLFLAPWLMLAATCWLLWFLIRQQIKAHRMGPERIRRLRELQHQRRERTFQRRMELVRMFEAKKRKAKGRRRR